MLKRWLIIQYLKLTLSYPLIPLYRYDFNGDGLISKEDVRIVLSYIPFKRNIESAEDKLTAMSSGVVVEKKQKEGLYE